MWTIYRVRWQFITQLCASVPGRSNLIEGWLNARKPAVRPPSSKSLTETAEEVIATLAEPDPPEDEAQMQTLVFQRVEGRLMVRMATIKAHLKDCAYQLQTYVVGYIQGDRSLRVKVANGIYWPHQACVDFMGTPYVPVLEAETGKTVTEPSGVREKAIHVMTPQGQRNALKAFEYVNGAAFEYKLAILTAPARQIRRGKEIVNLPGRPTVNREDLESLMQYGGLHGYGGERSEDGGRYMFTITEEEEQP